MINSEFNEVVSYLPCRIKNVLLHISESIKTNTYEIRIRNARPVVLFGSYGVLFVNADSSVNYIGSDCVMCADDDDVAFIVNSICGYSLYTHQNDIAQGFVTFGNGHRAGFCGTAVIENDKISAMRSIDSINLRIAKNAESISSDIFNIIVENTQLNGIIVCGPPCSGKTTFLRSFAKKCSSSYGLGYLKTVVIDERFELGTDCGVNCDILRGFSKYDGITFATRVLSPDLVICDEVCSEKEAEEIIRCCYSGIKFALSLHTDSIPSLIKRPVAKILLESGFFDYVILLDSKCVGKIENIIKTEDIKNEFVCNNIGYA